MKHKLDHVITLLKILQQLATAYRKMSKHVSKVDKLHCDSGFPTFLTVTHSTEHILHCNPVSVCINMDINNLNFFHKKTSSLYYGQCIMFSILLQSISFNKVLVMTH